MATLQLLATQYTRTSTGVSVTNPANAYTDTSSTTYAEVGANSSGAELAFFGGFDFTQIPSDATNITMTFKAKVKSSTSSTRYYVGLYDSNTGDALSATTQTTTTATTYTLTLSSLSFADVIALGDDFSFGFSKYSTSQIQSVYGMEVNVTYDVEPRKNKVIYNGNTLIDLTGDTATEADVALGKLFHLANGEQATGTGGGLNYETGTWSPSSNTTTAPTINFANTHTEQPAAIAFADVSTSSRANGYFISYTYTNLALLIPDWAMPSGGSWKSKYNYYVYASSTSGETVATPTAANIDVSNTYFKPYTWSTSLRSNRVYNWIAIWV